MKKKILFEFLYFLLSLIIGLFGMALLCRSTYSKTIFVIPVFGNNIQMTVGLMLSFFLLVSLFILTLVRQFKQKFKNLFHNFILLISGLALTYFFLNFIDSAQNMKNVFGKEFSAEKITGLNYEIALFSFLQILVTISVIKAVINSTLIVKKHCA
ncbi:hypothetical protein SAMN05443549_1153 [Flavobacterium fluvii]|uniref:Uncharacterized protein n=1 Tax=Flavobacterium fluvii TaxID=468056 RepID=A0A1M5PZA6_9FLAO|nr:hypothetical protein [Flavobacterium fluvii]SHH06881.1 hypothetical protein SAMN05443549_1153 [Flavobacterium fluvii]